MKMNWSEHTKIQRKEMQKQIEELQMKLKALEEKSPAEIAYKRVYGRYPNEELDDYGIYYDTTWTNFMNGYESAQKDHKVGEYKPTPQKDKVSLFDRLTTKNSWLNSPTDICHIVRGFLIDEGVVQSEDEDYITVTLQKSLIDAPNEPAPARYYDQNLPYSPSVGN